ncbi:MAG: hydrogenase expression protein HupH [Methylobacteriaceae bacterium]|nr:hydrogenase expression protein HupH [Methylobacteriaceae bacterium]
MTRILLLARAPSQARWRDALDPRTSLVLRAPDGAPAFLDSAQDWALADLAMLAAGQGAQAEGFDAVCVGEVGDFGAAALRSVLTIPVVAAGRCAMLHALTLGGRVGLVAPDDQVNRLRKLIAEYGLAAQCPVVRGYDPRGGVGASYEAARAAIERDGADVLCLAGAAAEAARLAAALPAPLVEPVAVALACATNLLALGLTHSRKAWPAPQTPKPDLVARLAQAARR